MAEHKIDGNGVAGNVQAPDRIWLTTTESGKVDDWTQWLDDQEQLHPEAPRTEYIRADVAEAELAAMTAARDELASAIDDIETSHGLTDNGNLWRFWAKKAREIADKNTNLSAQLSAANARVDAARDSARDKALVDAADAAQSEAEQNVGGEYYIARVIVKRILALRDKPAPAVTVHEAAKVLLDAFMRKDIDPLDAVDPQIEALAIKHSGNRGDPVIQLEIAEEFFCAALRSIAASEA